jgi:hypothetical protein
MNTNKKFKKYILALFTFTFISGCTTEVYHIDASKKPLENLTFGEKDINYSNNFKKNLLNKDILEIQRKRYAFNRFPFSNGSDESNLHVIKKLNPKVIRLLRYKIDEEDSWDSYVSNVLNNKTFVGDCDDLANTSAELAIIGGVPKEKLMRLWLLPNDKTDETHMAVGYLDEQGDIWIFGDTYRTNVVKLGQTNNYKLIAYSKYDWMNQEDKWQVYDWNKHKIINQKKS